MGGGKKRQEKAEMAKKHAGYLREREEAENEGKQGQVPIACKKKEEEVGVV